MQKHSSAQSNVQNTGIQIDDAQLSALAHHAETNKRDGQFFQRCLDTIHSAARGSGTWYVQLGLTTDTAIDLLRNVFAEAGISTSVQHFRDDELLELCV